MLRDENRRLTEGMSKSDFIVNVGIIRRDIGNDQVGLDNLALDVLYDHSRSVGIIGALRYHVEFLAYRLDHVFKSSLYGVVNCMTTNARGAARSTLNALAAIG